MERIDHRHVIVWEKNVNASLCYLVYSIP